MNSNGSASTVTRLNFSALVRPTFFALGFKFLSLGEAASFASFLAFAALVFVFGSFGLSKLGLVLSVAKPLPGIDTVSILVLFWQLAILEKLVGAHKRLSIVKKARRRVKLDLSGFETRVVFNPAPILILMENEDLTALVEPKFMADLVANINL